MTPDRAQHELARIDAILEQLKGDPDTVARWRRENELKRHRMALQQHLGGSHEPLRPIEHGTRSRHKRSEMSTTEKVRYIGRHGRERYLALPW